MEPASPDSRAGRWLGPGELARRLGVSIKTLRVYERAGLIVPGRREGGWRTYGPKDIARLHEVLALRSLGLSLAEVKAALDAPASSLRRTLDIQQRHLAAQIAAGQKRLAAINEARRRLDRDGGLGVDELLALSSATVAPPVSADQVEAIIHGHAQDHGNEDLDRFQRDLKARLAEAGIDHAEFERALSSLVADASLAAQTGDPASEQGREIAERWTELIEPLGARLTRTQRGLGEGVFTFADALIGDPDLCAALAFLKQAVAAHRASAVQTG